MLYCISDGEHTDCYDARIELEGTAILLQSRGGGSPPRNTGYSKALLTIIRRLRAGDHAGQPVIARVLLDSQPARKMPADKRLLAQSAELSGLGDDETITLIRSRAKGWGQTPGVSGGNSTKALRIETQGCSREILHAVLGLMDWKDRPPVARLSAAEQNRVTASHIDRAVGRLRSGEQAPNFDDSRDYDVLLDDGTRLAPKKIFGLALEDVLGIEAFPEHFSAGWGQPCFRILEGAGYLIIPKEEPAPTADEILHARNVLPATGTTNSASEGALRLVMHMRKERDPGLAADKKASFIAEHGSLHCERCRMDPAAHYEASVAAACIEVHHARVQVRDMQAGHVTVMEDLQCLCANCHRVIHRELAVAARKLRAGNRSHPSARPQHDRSTLTP